MPNPTPGIALQATDAKGAAKGMSTFGGYRAIRDRYKKEYEAGLANLAQGYPAICAAMVKTAIGGNPLAAKWCADQLNFGERTTTESATTNVLQIVLGGVTREERAAIPAEWRVKPLELEEDTV